jgi:hypothetical protein
MQYTFRSVVPAMGVHPMITHSVRKHNRCTGFTHHPPTIKVPWTNCSLAAPTSATGLGPTGLGLACAVEGEGAGGLLEGCRGEVFWDLTRGEGCVAHRKFGSVAHRKLRSVAHRKLGSVAHRKLRSVAHRKLRSVAHVVR